MAPKILGWCLHTDHKGKEEEEIQNMYWTKDILIVSNLTLKQ